MNHQPPNPDHPPPHKRAQPGAATIATTALRASEKDREHTVERLRPPRRKRACSRAPSPGRGITGRTRDRPPDPNRRRRGTDPHRTDDRVRQHAPAAQAPPVCPTTPWMDESRALIATLADCSICDGAVTSLRTKAATRLLAAMPARRGMQVPEQAGRSRNSPTEGPDEGSQAFAQPSLVRRRSPGPALGRLSPRSVATRDRRRDIAGAPLSAQSGMRIVGDEMRVLTRRRVWGWS
jgi:hypothetical protein